MSVNTKDSSEESNNDDTDTKRKKTIINKNLDNKKQTIFLNWINRFNSNSNNNNNNNNNNSIKNNIVNQQNKSENCKNLDEYRGVQGLKEFWNNHITIVRNKQPTKSATLDGVHRRYSSFESNLTSSKSIGCLLNDRSLSFEGSSNVYDENFTIDNIDDVVNDCGDSHLKSDNFYKYRNASTKQQKHLSLNENIEEFFIANSNQKEQQLQQQEEKQKQKQKQRQSELKVKVQKVYGIGTNFPLIAATSTGEKIHWAKREDILVNRKLNREQKQQQKQQNSIIYSSVKPVDITQTQLEQLPNKRINVIINDKKCSQISDDKNISKNSDASVNSETNSNNNNKNNNNNNPEIMAVKSSTMTDTRDTKTTMNEVLVVNTDNKTDSICGGSGGGGGSSKSYNGSTNSLSSDSPMRRKNITTRKCSFKTHAKTYYGGSRKMSSYSSGSKVAALTHQFNQLVQKDAGILEEIKKKNGILMSRAGHVYKVKEENDNGRKKTIKKDSGGDDVSLKSGKRKATIKKSNSAKILKNNNEISGDGTVKATVKKFENKENKDQNGGQNIEEKLNQKLMVNVIQKPKVPLKSEQVLQRTREIVLRNQKNQKKMKVAIETVASKIENQSKILEETAEETKNCQDNVDNLVTETDVILEKPSKPPAILGSVETTKDTSTLEIISDGNESKDTVDISIKTQNEANETENSKRCKYSRLYEKFRFRSPFQKKTELNDDHSPIHDLESLTNADKSSENPDRKIVDALETVNKKLEHLSKSTNDISIQLQNDEDRIYEELKAKMKPNDSFLFRGNSRHGLSADGDPNSETIIEAVNCRLINKTQSMDEKNFSSLLSVRQISLEDREYPMIVQKTDEILDKFKTTKEEENEIEEEKTLENIINVKIEQENDYEPITIRDCLNIETTNLTQKSFLYKKMQLSPKNESNYSSVPETMNDDHNNIYQTVAEVKREILKNRNSISSYESVENYESVSDDDRIHNTEKEKRISAQLEEDGYDICDPPEPPPPRKSEGDIRNTSDELPPLPAPKRIFSDIRNIKLDTTNGKNKIQHHNVITIATETLNVENIDDEHCYDDENIYDTIKGSETLSHCYESLNSKHISASMDIVSVSNCYESIGSIRRNAILRHSDSISTLSSDQKTNSLYGMTLGQLQRSSLVGDCSSDDNSDEWIDISDGEEDDRECQINKHQFIVVRERTKCHRSPDWSRRVRDQRCQQQQQQQITNYIDDDSDHYYEPLYARDDNISNNPISGNESIIKNVTENNHRPQLTPLIMSNNVNYHKKTTSIADNSLSDDYDSFDTDEESDEEIKKNDSGVDISNAKLPDPPPSTNQVYAFVKKMKNFISSKKTSSSSSLSKIIDNSSSSKPYENTQFYVSVMPEYQNTTTVRGDKKNKSSRSGKLMKTSSSSKLQNKSTGAASTTDSLYENTEFHTPRIPITATTATATGTTATTTTSSSSQMPENNSSPYTIPIIQKIDGTEEINNSTEIITRKKSKSGKSFKSKLRKSLGGADSGFSIGGSTLNTARSTFYISDSVDVDSGIFEKNPSSDTNLSPAPSTEQCDQNQKSAVVTRKTKNSTGSPELNRRKTTLGIRPSNPPPPPPIDKKVQKKRTPTTSWYAECGVFKSSSQNDEMMLKDGRAERSSSTSWYAEAGLYQTSGASVASSSGSSGVSTGGEGGPGDDNSHSMFSNEPLYQIYSAAKLESISRDMEEQDSTDGYEEIGTHAKPEEQGRKSSRPSALQLVGPKQGPSRTLWSEIPEVVNSGILGTLTSTEKRLQEAKFEILTSEASYLKSLNLLRTHFMNHPAFRDTSVLSSSDRKALFSHIVPVHECSDRLLCDLENCWQDNIMLIGLSKSLYKHAEKYFHVYISFCEHQGKMDRTLRKLKEMKGTFSQTLDMLETDPACCGLNLHSFLMLPMQRITRLPLLIDAVFSKVKQDDDEYEDWKMTLAILNKIVSQCNDAAHRCEQAYEIEKISRQIEFPSNIRSLAIAPVGITLPGKKPRSLVKKGELIHLIWRGDDAKLTFGKKFTKCNIFIFLFTDLLVFTKKKNEEQYTVFDYCPRSMITVSSGDTIPQLPIKELSQSGKNLFLLTLLENHERKTIEMILSCPSVSEQQRWLQALSPPESENPDEKLYEQWDCPQVIAKHEYSATEPDLLSLEPGDVVNVTRKMADGWYQGERIRDGATGWFPGSYTEEVNSPHVRARNLKQRYRLLTFTASYLETMKRTTNK